MGTLISHGGCKDEKETMQGYRAVSAAGATQLVAIIITYGCFIFFFLYLDSEMKLRLEPKIRTSSKSGAEARPADILWHDQAIGGGVGWSRILLLRRQASQFPSLSNHPCCLFLTQGVSGGLELQGEARRRSGGHLITMSLGRAWAHAWEGARSQA